MSNKRVVMDIEFPINYGYLPMDFRTISIKFLMFLAVEFNEGEELV